MNLVRNLHLPTSWDIDPVPRTSNSFKLTTLALTVEQREQVIIGLYVFVMVVGVLLVFFGQRLYKSLLSAVGALIFFLIGWGVLSATTSYSQWVVVAIALPISLVGGSYIIASYLSCSTGVFTLLLGSTLVLWCLYWLHHWCFISQYWSVWLSSLQLLVVLLLCLLGWYCGSHVEGF